MNIMLSMVSKIFGIDRLLDTQLKSVELF